MRYYQFMMIFLTTLIFCQEGIQAQETIIRLEHEQDLLQIDQQLSFYEDTSQLLTITEVQNKTFQPHTKDVFSTPATRSAIWFKFTVQNHTEEDAWLEIGSLFAWYIDFYAPDNQNQYAQPIQTGSARPQSSKKYRANTFWLPLNQASQPQSQTYYIRIATEFPMELPMYIGTIRALHHQKETNDILTGGFVGVILIMFLYNGFLY